MVSVGFWVEFALIALLALIIIDPKDLPKIMQALGRFFAKAHKFYQSFIKELEHQLYGKDTPPSQESRMQQLPEEATQYPKTSTLDNNVKKRDPTNT